MPITVEIQNGIDKAAGLPEGEEVNGLFSGPASGPAGPESVKEQLNALEQSTAPPLPADGPQKRKPGRPKGSKSSATVQASEEPPPFDPEGLGMLVRVLVSWGEKRMPNPIPTSETELDLLSKTSTELARKYLPKAMEYSVELAFVTAAVVWTLPRLQRSEPPQRKVEPVTDGAT